MPDIIKNEEPFKKRKKKIIPSSININTASKLKNDELKTLLDISVGLYYSNTPEEVGKTIFDNLKKFKRGNIISGKLSIYDPDIDEYKLVYHTYTKNEELRKLSILENLPRKLKDVKDFSGYAILEKKAVLISDSHSPFAVQIDQTVLRRPAHSMVFIPIFNRENFIGLFSFARSPVNSIDEEFMGFLESIGKYCGLALEKILNQAKKEENEKNLQIREMYLEALSGIQQILLTSRIDEEKYKKITGILGSVTHSSRSYIFKNAIKEDDILLVDQISEWCLDQKALKSENHLLKKYPFSKYYPEWHNEFINGKCICSKFDINSIKDADLVLVEDLFSFLLIPIKSDENYYGFIGFENNADDHRYTQAEINLLKSVALSISIAIEREETQKALLQSEGKSKRLLEKMLNGFVLVKLIKNENGIHNDFIFLEVNPAFEKMTGLGSDAVRGKKGSEVNWFPDLPLIDIFNDILLKEESYHIDYHSLELDKQFEIDLFHPDDGFIAIFIQDTTDRYKKDKSLQVSQERYKKLLASITDYIYTVKIENGQVISTIHGPGCEAVTGYSPEDFNRQTYLWFDMIYPDDRNMVTEQATKTLIEDFSESIEHRIIRKGGEVIWIRNTLVPHYDSNHVMTSYDGVIQNITLHKEWELSLQKERDRAQSYLDVIGVMLVALDLEGRITLINKMGCEILGYKEHELIGQNWFDICLPANTRNMVKDYFQKIISGRAELTEHFQNNIISKSGEVKVIDFHNAILRDDFNNIKSVLSSGEDITSRKIAEEERDRLFNFSIDMLYIAGFDGYFKQLNPAWSKTLGWTINELLDVSWIDFVHKDDKQSTMQIEQVLLKGKEIVSFENRFICKDERYKWLSWNIFPLVEKGLLFGVVRDITDRKNSEAEHSRLQNLESLGVLAGGIAHDFNNILGMISGRVSLALMSISDEETITTLAGVERAVTRATSLTNQLLTFARGGKPLKKIIPLRQLIQDTARFALSGSNIEILFNFNETLSVEADPGQIGQVIQNLVINSVQAMPVGGIINISSEDSIKNNDHFVKIIIKDSGIGIPREYIGKIFDPYFTTKQSGSGLGLSVCYSILKKHDGNIIVDSIQGEGTVFTILLPASVKKIDREKSVNKKLTRELKVLIMDDDQEIREILSNMLKKLGHTVVETREGSDTIEIYEKELIRKHGFDLVFLDLTIKGGMGGKDTIQLLKRIHPQVKAVVSSGYADSSIADFKDEGFCGKLNKPYTINELRSVIYDVFHDQ